MSLALRKDTPMIQNQHGECPTYPSDLDMRMVHIVSSNATILLRIIPTSKMEKSLPGVQFVKNGWQQMSNRIPSRIIIAPSFYRQKKVERSMLITQPFRSCRSLGRFQKRQTKFGQHLCQQNTPHRRSAHHRFQQSLQLSPLHLPNDHCRFLQTCPIRR